MPFAYILPPRPSAPGLAALTSSLSLLIRRFRLLSNTEASIRCKATVRLCDRCILHRPTTKQRG